MVYKYKNVNVLYIQNVQQNIRYMENTPTYYIDDTDNNNPDLIKIVYSLITSRLKNILGF